MRVPSCRKVGAELPSMSFPMLGEGRDMKPRVPKVLIALLLPFKSATGMIFFVFLSPVFIPHAPHQEDLRGTSWCSLSPQKK